MVSVVGVQFKKAGKIYYFDPDGAVIERGTKVIVETARGIEFGEAVIGNREVEEKDIIAPLKKVLRIAGDEDIKQVEENREKEKDAFNICLQKIRDHHLEMKLIDVEYTFDRNKVLFYFTADGRVDFRELVKDLASIFKTRIELRQIGVRDEAKMLGGLGICGHSLCCATFLGEFEPVSIKMAKEQNLSLNPSKISGTCGRLMCCLKYEQDAYEDALKKIPKISAIVSTPGGQGVVVDVSLLKETVKVKMDKDNENVLQVYPVSDIKVIKDVENRQDDVNLDDLKHLEDN
ncbi:stage 0 sporulation family protein [Petroclostridium sp. X23]|uniref:PSP1 domain-containing protein n=1 Tax=Petroclostridium sp. X23 TaxID=3045146 RepID=UPI0024ACAE9F|nr:stage 0 sporulation family protein [Petroclostridium sp. X23]WHH57069.1 stage 0 sporulation family protein [Petroclostridium sp. X23]